MAQEQQDPRFRPFRIAMWAVYFSVLVFFGGSITYSVIRSVLAMSPPHRATASETLTPQQCIDRAKGLWLELDEHRKGLSVQPEVRRADADYWTKFRVDWLGRHRQAEAMCAVETPGRENLKAIFKRLDQTMILYTTHATQFAGEVGPTVDALKTSLAGQTP